MAESKGRGDSPSSTNRPRGNRNRMECDSKGLVVTPKNEEAIPASRFESPLSKKVYSSAPDVP